MRDTSADAGLDTKPRIHEIDGLRGWCALAVVLFHFFWETFGVAHVEIQDARWKFFLDGPLAVYVFFILSADSLTTLILRDNGLASWKRGIAKRYMRLAVPVFFGTALTYFFMKADLIFNQEAAAIVHRESWLGQFLVFSPTAGSIFWYSFAGVYGWLDDYPYQYNSFLWSIGVEWTGSVAVFLAAPVLKDIKFPALWLSIFAGITFATSPYLGMFVVGMVFAFLRDRSGIFELRKSRVCLVISTLVLIVSYKLDFNRQYYPPLSGDTLVAQIDSFLRDNYYNIAAPVFVAAIYMNRIAILAMSAPLSQFLGRISYSLYIIQMLVLCSFLSGLIVAFPSSATNVGLAVLLAAVSVGFCVLAAWVFSHAEISSLKKVNALAKYLIANTGR